MCEWGRREGELSSRVRDSWEEAVLELTRGTGLLSLTLLLLLDMLLDLSRSVFIQLDSSCLDR